MSAPRQSLPDRLKDYVFVNERVDEFHDRYPDGRIVTDMSMIGDNLVSFKAAVYRNHEDAEPAATGHAVDTINVQNSTFEKCETAAVGRALAFLNFKTKRGIASREEMEKAERHQRPAAREAQPDRSAPLANKPQIAAIQRKCDAAGLDIATECQRRYGVAIESLTANDAIAWINER
jgi:hypothetical protein